MDQAFHVQVKDFYKDIGRNVSCLVNNLVNAFLNCG